MGTRKINTARESYRDPKQLISSNMRFAREIRIQEHEATDANRQKYKFSGSEKSKSFYFLEIVKHSGNFSMPISANERRFTLTRARKRGIPIA